MLNRYVVSPCVSFAPTRWAVEGGAHQPDEYIEIARLLECIRTVVYAAVDWCGCE